jgi:hypothetical protein
MDKDDNEDPESDTSSVSSFNDQELMEQLEREQIVDKYEQVFSLFSVLEKTSYIEIIFIDYSVFFRVLITKK